MIHSRSLLAFMLLAFCGETCQSIEFKVVVTGSKNEGTNVVVRVPVELEGTVSERAVILSGDGHNVLGQLTNPSVLAEGNLAELHFVLPYLAADEKVTLFGKTIDDGEVAYGFHFDDVAGKHTELKLGERPVLRYMYEALDKSSPERVGETYKVYHHVYDPTGSYYVTKGPGGKFPHHRGLFFGFNRISYGNKEADIWHCRNGEHQAQREFLREEIGPVLGRHLLAIDWHGRDNDVFAKETRELTAYNVEGAVLIDFASVLVSQVGPVRLDGDPQHAGFQFRGSQEIPDKTAAETYYLRPDGKGEPGRFRNWSSKENESDQNLKHINLPWNAMSFVLGNQRYTCCYIDHPSNPKPARYSERDYGRFGSYFEYDLDEDNPLKLNYRIWLQEGEMTVDEVNQLSRDFVTPATVEVAVAAR